MARDFLFVDGIGASSRDGERRKAAQAARRHVMLGKNLGRTLHRRSRLQARPKQQHPDHDREEQALAKKTSVPPSPFKLRSTRPPARYAYGLLCQPPDLYRTLSIPVEVCPASRKVIAECKTPPLAPRRLHADSPWLPVFELTSQRLYPVKIRISLFEAKRTWLTLLFTDEDAYHCNIALMRACNEVFLYNGASSTKALFYISQTLALVRRRIRDDTTLSDGTIAIVLSLVMQEQVRGHTEQAAIHFQGLQRIVQYRGGLEQLHHNRELMLKTAKVDISFALEKGDHPVYYRDCMPDLAGLAIKHGIPDRVRLHSPVPWEDQDSAGLSGVRSDLLDLCHLLNGDEGGSDRLSLHDLYETNASIMHRLLAYRTLAESLHTEVTARSIEHLGLIIFMTTTLLDNDRRHIVNYLPLRRCIEHTMNGSLDSVHHDPIIWFCNLSLIWSADGPNTPELEECLKKSIARAGITSWSGVRAAMSRLPWLDAVHDAIGRSTWYRLSKC